MEQITANILWLAGFSNGDFSIPISVRPSPKSKLKWRISIKLTWSQNEIPFVAGFLDADGAIKIRVSRTDQYSLGYSTSPDITIDSSDVDVIEKVKSILIQNGIEVPQRQSFSNRGIPMTRLEIIKLTEVRKTLELLIPYLVGRKRIQAELMLTNILPIFESGRHLTKEGFIELMELRDVMVLSKKKDIRKYKTTYFKKLWNL